MSRAIAMSAEKQLLVTRSSLCRLQLRRQAQHLRNSCDGSASPSRHPPFRRKPRPT